MSNLSTRPPVSTPLACSFYVQKHPIESLHLVGLKARSRAWPPVLMVVQWKTIDAGLTLAWRALDLLGDGAPGTAEETAVGIGQAATMFMICGPDGNIHIWGYGEGLTCCWVWHSSARGFSERACLVDLVLLLLAMNLEHVGRCCSATLQWPSVVVRRLFRNASLVGYPRFFVSQARVFVVLGVLSRYLCCTVEVCVVFLDTLTPEFELYVRLRKRWQWGSDFPEFVLLSLVARS
ncbi:hypothetical protein Taro_056281 [Colocasia esculenta]|uniref:Uncharacterized protein n=1 Tax=Colocasia esculenta TaxID=4460 RepID=A0A843XT42_COLES|nr:hypothetical protein [Colocasia esculenta]